MFLSKWLSTEEGDEFARALAQDLAGRLPPPTAVSTKAVTLERMNNTRDALRARTVAFARTQNLNWYKKAHLANTFKWALREAGYDEKFVDAWTYDLMLFISSRKKES